MAKYGYQYRNGGFLGYEGTSTDLKEYEEMSAEWNDDEDHVTITATFKDGNIKIFECDIEETDNGVKLKNKKGDNNDRL